MGRLTDYYSTSDPLCSSALEGKDRTMSSACIRSSLIALLICLGLTTGTVSSTALNLQGGPTVTQAIPKPRPRPGLQKPQRVSAPPIVTKTGQVRLTRTQIRRMPKASFRRLAPRTPAYRQAAARLAVQKVAMKSRTRSRTVRRIIDHMEPIGSFQMNIENDDLEKSMRPWIEVYGAKMPGTSSYGAFAFMAHIPVDHDEAATWPIDYHKYWHLNNETLAYTVDFVGTSGSVDIGNINTIKVRSSDWTFMSPVFFSQIAGFAQLSFAASWEITNMITPSLITARSTNGLATFSLAVTPSSWLPF